MKRRCCLLLLPLIVFAALVIASPLLRAGEAEDRAEITKLEHALGQVLAVNDTAALEARFAPDWKLVGADGKVVTRDELMKTVQSGKLKFSNYEASELDVRVYGEAAVVIGRNRYRGSVDGEEFTSADRFTDVFIRQDGKWRCVSTHTSTLE